MPFDPISYSEVKKLEKKVEEALSEGVDTLKTNKIEPKDGNKVTIQGDLDVVGNVTYVETTNLQVKDNIIELNSGETGSGVTLGSAGITIDRGTESDAQVIWDENNDKFVFKLEDGTKLPVEVSNLNADNVSSSSTTTDNLTVNNTANINTVNATNLNVDNGVLYVDSSNDKVGIGTSTPENKLHVVANASKLQIGCFEGNSGKIYLGDFDGNVPAQVQLNNKSTNNCIALKIAGNEEDSAVLMQYRTEDNKWHYVQKWDWKNGKSILYLNLEPITDNSKNLGSSDKRWKEINSVSVVGDYVKAKWQDTETIYVSPDGGGDGSSPDSPTTLDDALTRAKARRVVIVLVDGEYHISKNYELFGDYIEIKSQSGDASKVKIVFDTYVSGNYNVSYSLQLLGNVVLRFTKVTLENAPKANTDYGWTDGGGIYVPINVSGNVYRQGTVMFNGCTINQTRDYFISAKHGAGAVIFSGTTINMSEDAIALINNNFGVVHIGWYSSSITSGYKLTTGLQGRDVLFSGNINSVSASKTWFSAVPEDILPTSDNSKNLGSSDKRWKNVYAVNVNANTVNGSLVSTNSDNFIDNHGIVIGSTSARANGERLEMYGPNSSMILSVQDGNGRIQLKWNATRGTGEKFLVGGENAGMWEFDPSNPNVSLFEIKYASGSGKNAGDSIPWENILQCGLSGLKIFKSGIYPGSDNQLNLGDASHRWKNAYVVNLYTGDIKLMNNWTVTERDENGEIIQNGVRILNDKGEEVFKVTEEGIFFKGKKLKLVFEE